MFAQRRSEADEFYAGLQQAISDADARLVQRQAFAGMIWSKQFFHYDVPVWLQGDPAQPPPPPERKHGRNSDWKHLNNADVISMPDKWEYPWFAAWDWAFHCVALAEIDAEFAKSQLVLLMREWYMHPNGQLPAYEWAFGDVNPPVHAWSAFRVFQIDRRQRQRNQSGGHRRLGFSGTRLSKAAAEFHLVGQPQGRARAGIFFKAAFSAWTTSAVSTAASRCRPADSSARPTARAGWRCIA